MVSGNIVKAGGTRSWTTPSSLRYPANIRTSEPETEAYIDKANVLYVVSPGLDELMASTRERLFVSDGGTFRDQYESNRSWSVNLEVALELGSTKVASSPQLGIPLSRYYPEISRS